jgi:hypothetical protein
VLYNRDETFLREQFAQLSATRKNDYNNDFNQYLSQVDKQWQDVLNAANTALPFIEKNFGAYPYKQYSFIHGGDGGMEYPMATLLAGPGIGTVFHEWMHSWYQMILGTNESLYAWMDEGFTDFATNRVQAYYRENVLMKRAADNPAYLKQLDSVSKLLPKYDRGSYLSYINLAKSGLEEPLTTHADHFNTNFAYSAAAYSKGAVFLGQLGYIAGDAVRDKILLEYYRIWKFKHPNANDFLRVAENVSGLKLDWYKEYFVNSTKTIDYGIDSLWEEGGKSKIRLKMIGKMPMPIDLAIEYKDGKKELAYIPTYQLFGEKPAEDGTENRVVHEAWKWTHPTYVVEISGRLSNLKLVEIDPSQRMADLERRNNRLEIP